MKTDLQNLLPDNDESRKRFAVGLTVIVAGLLTLLGIYGIGEYGMALFLLTPLFIGAAPTILYGQKKSVSKKESFLLALCTLAIFSLLLLLFAMEGLICIIMALPIALLLAWIGSIIGCELIKKAPKTGSTTLLILVGIIPTVAFTEKDIYPSLTQVTTSIIIDAPPKTVWENVVEFPQLSEPTEFIFKTGIAYPINATIIGKGVGAIRHCNFTTGSFVEPITIWDEPKLLKFSVVEQPAPMKEIGFWDIDAPHLHDYFVSKEGQFKLTELSNGKTLLEGTTWYHHRIKPAFYWRLWSESIVHKIHERVLKHIKWTVENDR